MSKYNHAILISVNIGLLVAVLGFIVSFVYLMLFNELRGLDSPEMRPLVLIAFYSFVVTSILSFVGSWLVRLNSVPPTKRRLLVADRVVGGILSLIASLMIAVALIALRGGTD